MTCGPIIAESQKDDSSTSLQHTLNHPSMVGSSASLPGQSPDSNATNQPEILKSQSQSDSDDSNESGSLPSKSSSTIDSSGTGSLGQSDGLAFKSSKRHKTSKRKKDRSKLRKGKWTVRDLLLESTLRCMLSILFLPWSILLCIYWFHRSWKKRNIPLASFTILVLDS